MEFDEIANSLYGLVPSEFTAARTVAVKDARGRGERDLAARIQALGKPTLPAWAVNQLMREHHAEMSVLLDLGRELRAGLSGVSGDELRQLTKRRHQLVAGLIDLARTTATTHGLKLTDASAGGVRATLEATLADADSADLVGQARLSEALQSSGFGFGMAPTPKAEPEPDPGSPVSDLGAHRKRKDAAIAKARAELSLAESAAEQAQALRDGAEARLQKANDDRDAQLATIARLRRKLERATGELDDLSTKVKKRKAAKSDADRLAREAELERIDAEKRLNTLL